MKIYAKIDESGTAIYETALCSNCFPDAQESLYSGEYADATLNDSLQCQVCGAYAENH